MSLLPPEPPAVAQLEPRRQTALLPRAPSAKRLFLVDAHSYLYQAFYAIGELQTPAGVKVGAVFGFAQLVEKILDQGATHLAVVFDSKGETFRSRQFADYKIHRPAMPEDLALQIPIVKELLRAHKVAVLEKEGYEADDIIATLARRGSGRGIETLIVTKDKDLEQLIDDSVRIWSPKDGTCIDAQGLLALKGLRPDQVIDFLALAGDQSDNVPGVQGIGQKTALKILAAAPNFDAIFAVPIPGLTPRLQDLLKKGEESARLSRTLVTLDDRCPIPEADDLELCALQPPDRTALADLFMRLQFRRLLEKCGAPGNAARVPSSSNLSSDGSVSQDAATSAVGTDSPPPAEEPRTPLPFRHEVVTTREALAALVERMKGASVLAVDTETTGLNPFRDELVGVALATPAGAPPAAGDGTSSQTSARSRLIDAAYVPLRAPEPLPWTPSEGLEALRPLLEDAAIPKTGHNVKFDLLFLRRAGVRTRPVAFDSMLAGYLLNPEVRGNSLEALAADYLGEGKVPLEAQLGQDKDAIRMAELPLGTIGPYAAKDADLALRLHGVLRDKLEEAGLRPLMDDVEAPLLEVLTAMENTGIALDPGPLHAMAATIRATLTSLTTEIHALAGKPFNVASPAQLAQVLYEGLGLPPGPKGKSGVASTAADVLEEIRARHPIVEKILEFRELTKLLGTYVEALPALVEPATGRIHTSFNQTVAATGRLSSSNPNLQNIPIKTELGREIRKAFVAGEPGWMLLSADYSQIELRMLAHFSEDPVLLDAFARGEDIHRSVAAQLYGVEPAQVTGEMRRAAKTVNFGIIYGQTSYGLSQELKISVEEAAAIIHSYFDRHAGVRLFMDGVLAQARVDGCVRTILGRRRPIRDLASRNQRLRSFAERAAVNSVIQGSAADLIKVAMNNIFTDLETRSSRARLLLQIHDELVLEAPAEEAPAELQRVREEMESAMELRVPLVVNTSTGRTWFFGDD